MNIEMNITSAQYTRNIEDTENVGISAVINGDTMWIPLEMGNRHYDEILRQVESGDLTIADAD